MTSPVGRDMSAIAVSGLSKSFGAVRAVDDLTFTVQPGTVTGFLGPNGAGKTTTLRMVLGLVTPSSGTATVNGRRYAEIPRPAEEVGAVLEATSFHPGRTARNHLRVLCAGAGLPRTRADEALEQVGLTEAANRRVGGYSMGMRQRLGLGAALLGRPRVLILDEPANGLDPQGIHWLRGLLRLLADDGCAVLVSSHVLSEVEHTVDSVVIIAGGRLIRQGPLGSLTAHPEALLRVRTSDPDTLSAALAPLGAQVDRVEPETLVVTGVTGEDVGKAALDAHVVVSELVPEHSDLEQIFLELTRTPGETSPARTPEEVR